MKLLEGRPWERPELTSQGRVPPSATLRRPAVSLNGRWDFALLPHPEAAVREWWTIEVPGLWTMQGFAPPQYTNVQMPFDERPPRVPEDNPTGDLPPPVRAAGGRAGGAALRRQRGSAVRRAQRRAGRHPQGRPHAGRVRRDRAPGGRQRARVRGRPVVGRELRRGPGPVVARRPAARRVPLRDAARAHRRRVRSRLRRRTLRGRRPRRDPPARPRRPHGAGRAGPAEGPAVCGRPRRRTSTRCTSLPATTRCRAGSASAPSRSPAGSCC